jgi:hypothetical protein
MKAKEIRGSATGPGNGKGFTNSHIRRGVDSQLGRDTSDKESGKKEGEGIRLHRERARPRRDYEGRWCRTGWGVRKRSRTDPSSLTQIVP